MAYTANNVKLYMKNPLTVNYLPFQRNYNE